MKYAEDYQIEEIADRSRYYNGEILFVDRIEFVQGWLNSA